MINPSTEPDGLSIRGILDFWAGVDPESIALLGPAHSPVTYADLLRQSEYVLNFLRAAGIGKNDRVAVALPNGLTTAAAFLAIVSTGVVAPLNPSSSIGELEFCMEDMGTRALIVEAGRASSAREASRRLGVAILELTLSKTGSTNLFSLIPSRSPVRPLQRDGFAQPDELALLLYTSGTTSRPKIVPLTQRNICSSAHSIRTVLELGREDRCLNVMPLFHAHGLVAGLLAPLAAGGSVVCAPGFQADRFLDWLEVFRPSWYTAVPTIHQAVLACAKASPERIEDAPLRFIRSATSALHPKLMADLEDVFKVSVVESYGMTEASPQITSNLLPPRKRKPGSAGVAAGPEVAIMNQAGEPVGAGSIGEIVIRGPNVMQGYEAGVEANADAFINGWFRTGDQGRIDRDGYLFLTGRLKEIINRGGEKVSPREVDETLLEHPAVEQAVAFSVPHPSLGEDLAAAVVLKRGAVASANELRDFAFRHMADHKVPSKMIVLDGIPKTATGKIQRLALAEKLADHLEDSYLAPETDTERLLAEAIGEVLGLSEVGIRNNFFALGGDSLRATRVIGRLNAELDLALPVPSLFHHPTIEELATRVDAALVERDERLEQMVAEIESLSDEEVERLLKES